MKIRVIGDVHGLYPQYILIAKEAEYSLQVGDMGFRYGPVIKALNSKCHKFVGGNHDNYTALNYGDIPNYLGDFGIWNGILFVRGAWSIDQWHRTEGIDWWPEEELNMEQCHKALEFYKANKPEIVVTHDCPESILTETHHITLRISNNRVFTTRTGQLLDAMLDAHKPKLWIFGHHHQNERFTHKGVNFVCLDELSYIDIGVD